MSAHLSYLDRVTVDHDSAMPPYRQLAAILRDRIQSGDLAPGAALPSVKTLRQEYGVAETTARPLTEVLRTVIMGAAVPPNRGGA